MKRLIAILPQLQAAAVCDTLYEAGAREITLTDIHQYRPGQHADEIYKGVRYTVNIMPCSRLDLVVEDADADAITALILATGWVDRVLRLAVEVQAARPDARFDPAYGQPAAVGRHDFIPQA